MNQHSKSSTHMFPREVLQRSKSNGDRRVEMGTGDVTSRQDDNHNGKPRGGCEAKQSLGALCLLVHNRCGCPSKDEYQSPNKLSSHLVPDPHIMQKIALGGLVSDLKSEPFT